jgi:hypothetical protein
VAYVAAITNSCGLASDTFKIKVNPAPVVQVTPIGDTICAGDSTRLCATAGLAAYNWVNGDSTACISVTLAGVYSVTVTNNVNCTAGSNQVSVNTYQLPPVTVTQSGDTLTSGPANSYQWLLNGQPIPGANSQIYIAQSSGSYSLQISDNNGCTATSTPVSVTGLENLSVPEISVYPNPSNGSWQLTVGNSLPGLTVEVYDAMGQIVFRQEVKGDKSEINIPGVANGIYELRIALPQGMAVKKLVKM